MFGTILISVLTFLHVYVCWRVGTVPFVVNLIPRTYLYMIGVILWLVFLVGRLIGHGGTGRSAALFEFIGMKWMAVLFLIFISLLAVDIVTFFGILLPRLSETARGWALVFGIILSVIALIQGFRLPVVQKYEISLAGLPEAMDGTKLIALSDMHLGSQLGERWLRKCIAQVVAQQPDIVVLVGDIFEGHGLSEGRLIRTFKTLTAPMGVWAVPGNHEFHGNGITELFEDIGFKLLRNQWAEVAPGLILAGVDNLGHGYRSDATMDDLSRLLDGHPPGAVILLSHVPRSVADAAKAGAGLMLSGHTHGGQIWPFNYLVRRRYPLFEGRYLVDDMTLLVSRGAGTWGPRMRLWRPGEILKITLRCAGNSK